MCAEGVVEHVVLLGAPVPVDVHKLRAVRSVVAGRFVNGFCRTDWLLSLCCRYRFACTLFHISNGSVHVVLLSHRGVCAVRELSDTWLGSSLSYQSAIL